MSRRCSLVINDEVNCFLSGLDRTTQSKINNALSFWVPGYRHMPKFRLGRWDGKIRFFKSGWTYTHLLDENVLSIIDEAGYEVDVDDRRTGKTVDIPPITADSDIFSGAVKADGTPITLRDYQVNAVNTALENPVGLFNMATGAGKTYVCGAIAKLYSQHGRVIIIVPSVDLVQQTADGFRELGLEDVGEFSGVEKVLGNVMVTTWQSLQNYLEVLEGTVCVIVDEVHKTKGDVVHKILSESCRNVVYRYGFTGTVPKDPLGQAQIRSVLGDVIFSKAAWELQQAGVLSECKISVLQTQENKRLSFADYHEEYRYLVTNRDRLEWTAGIIRELADKNTLVLTKSVETGKKLAEIIGDQAVFLYGGVKTKDRKVHYKSVNNLDGKILICTLGIASTGIDIPRIFNLVLFEIGKSFPDVIQSIGRGLRKAFDKDYVDIFDICASTKYSKRHLTERKKYYKEAKYPFEIIKVTVPY